MNGRRLLFAWVTVIPLLAIGVWVAGLTVTLVRGHVSAGKLVAGPHGRLRTQVDVARARHEPLPPLPELPDDPRLGAIRGSADSWRRALTPRRIVVDQVCLVADVGSFLEAMAMWDDRHFFPILIDEPAWTLPFLRAFRPARVVRYTSLALPALGLRGDDPAGPTRREAEWSRAQHAVESACSGSGSPGGGGGSDGTLEVLKRGAPGVVLSTPGSPMLAGAVALAAGHFQPLVQLGPGISRPKDRGQQGEPDRFHSVLTQPAAWEFARQVEACVSSVVGSYDQLGDRCDFLTLAGDWPYRYRLGDGAAPIRGVFALDDLIGRKLEGQPNEDGLNRSRRRWAYAGRLLGDPAASVARAMAALFLAPRSALLWNTYAGGRPWSLYNMDSSALFLHRVLPRSGAVVHRAGPRADLTSWHAAFDPASRYGLVMINTAGGADFFGIAGGPGRPGDVPRGIPMAVSMIHSFSAEDPLDAQTIAGRWLDQGAFVYYGSVWEPFLPAFRTPGLVCELAAAGIPLVAAVRQGELEPFGFPWRLVYLGDPLYRLSVPGAAAGRERLPPFAWRKAGPRGGDWPVIEIDPEVATASAGPFEGDGDREQKRLRFCLDAAIAGLVATRLREPPPRAVRAAGTKSPQNRPGAWRAVLRELRRDQLDRRERTLNDDLMIDTLGESGAWDELEARLERIPPGEAGPRVWQAIEMCALARLARLARSGEGARAFAQALDIWEGVMRLSWPQGSKFPAQITERVSGLVQADRAHRRALWLDRLRRAAGVIAPQPGRRSPAAVIQAERERVEAQLGGRSTQR